MSRKVLMRSLLAVLLSGILLVPSACVRSHTKAPERFGMIGLVSPTFKPHLLNFDPPLDRWDAVKKNSLYLGRSAAVLPLTVASDIMQSSVTGDLALAAFALLGVAAVTGSVGATVGGTLGTVQKTYPQEEVERGQELVRRVCTEVNFQNILREVFLRRYTGKTQYHFVDSGTQGAGDPELLADYRALLSGELQSVLEVAVMRIGLVGAPYNAEELQLELRARSRLQVGTRPPFPPGRSPYLTHYYYSERRHLEVWLADHGAELRQSVIEAFKNITEQMYHAYFLAAKKTE